MRADRHVAYWRANLAVMAVLLAAWFAVSFGAGIIFADALDGATLLGFPVGTWFATQGSIVAFVVLTFVYVWVMNRIDRRFGVYER